MNTKIIGTALFALTLGAIAYYPQLEAKSVNVDPQIDHHITAGLGTAGGSIHGDAGHPHMLGYTLIGGRRENVGAFQSPLEIGHFFRPFIHQQDKQIRIGVIL